MSKLSYQKYYLLQIVIDPKKHALRGKEQLLDIHDTVLKFYQLYKKNLTVYTVSIIERPARVKVMDTRRSKKGKTPTQGKNSVQARSEANANINIHSVWAGPGPSRGLNGNFGARARRPNRNSPLRARLSPIIHHSGSRVNHDIYVCFILYLVNRVGRRTNEINEKCIL